MNDEIKEILTKTPDGTNPKRSTLAKGVVSIGIVLLLGVLILTIGNLVSDSQTMRDQKNNLQKDELGNFVTRLKRDTKGLVVAEGQEGGKYTNEYTCDDFPTQIEAQNFFANAGGLNTDTKNLDDDKNGVACESLPKAQEE